MQKESGRDVLLGSVLRGEPIPGAQTVATIYAHAESDVLGTTTVSTMEIEAPLAGRALVVIVDDRTAHGDGKDSTGPLVTELLNEAGFLVDAVVAVAADEIDVRNALNTAVIGGVDLVISVGGTGVSPRDVTPDVTAEVLDREIPGISEALRSSGLAAGALDAGLSRGLVGVSGSTLVVNLASSRAAIRDGMATLTPLASQVIAEPVGTRSLTVGIRSWIMGLMAEDVTEEQERTSRARLERARLARIFGDVLPDRTTDESGENASPSGGSGEGLSESWLRDQTPPHHS